MPDLGVHERRSRCSRSADPAVHDVPILAFTIDRNPHWDQIDGTWAKFTGDEMKAGRPFRCPLSQAALAIVNAQPKVGPYVFTAAGTHGVTNWSDVKKVLDSRVAELLGRTIDRWTIHDLRRTLTTGPARHGVSLEVRDRVTDHKTRGMTAQVYTVMSWDEDALAAEIQSRVDAARGK
jgi:integrase